MQNGNKIKIIEMGFYMKIHKKQCAVFFDRDGTINIEGGYINHEDRFVLLPRVAQAIKKLNANNVRAIVCTNQAGVARGYFEEFLIKKVHAKMCALLQAKGAHLDAVYYCPHHPNVGEGKYRQDCSCRKPKTGMIEQAVQRFGIDKSCSYVMGDKISDIKWGHKAGMKAVMVLTGYGKGEYTYQRKQWTDTPDYIAKDAYDAVKWILKENSKSKTLNSK